MQTDRISAILAAILLAGCTSGRELADQREIISDQIHVIDSLAVARIELSERVMELTDSLQFIDDIRTGQYYRDMRSLRDRITRLEYALHQQEQGVSVAMLPADELFAPASAALTERGKRLLDAVAQELQARFDEHRIRVEGHADAAPLGPNLTARYASNWGLSAARAASVVEYLAERDVIESSRLEAIGFGDSRPVASNETPEGRRQNRRVRIAAVPTATPVPATL